MENLVNFIVNIEILTESPNLGWVSFGYVKVISFYMMGTYSFNEFQGH